MKKVFFPLKFIFVQLYCIVLVVTILILAICFLLIPFIVIGSIVLSFLLAYSLFVIVTNMIILKDNIIVVPFSNRYHEKAIIRLDDYSSCYFAISSTYLSNFYNKRKTLDTNFVRCVTFKNNDSLLELSLTLLTEKQITRIVRYIIESGIHIDSPDPCIFGGFNPVESGVSKTKKVGVGKKKTILGGGPSSDRVWEQIISAFLYCVVMSTISLICGQQYKFYMLFVTLLVGVLLFTYQHKKIPYVNIYEDSIFIPDVIVDIKNVPYFVQSKSFIKYSDIKKISFSFFMPEERVAGNCDIKTMIEFIPTLKLITDNVTCTIALSLFTKKQIIKILAHLNEQGLQIETPEFNMFDGLDQEIKKIFVDKK